MEDRREDLAILGETSKIRAARREEKKKGQAFRAEDEAEKREIQQLISVNLKIAEKIRESEIHRDIERQQQLRRDLEAVDLGRRLAELSETGRGK